MTAPLSLTGGVLTSNPACSAFARTPAFVAARPGTFTKASVAGVTSSLLGHNDENLFSILDEVVRINELVATGEFFGSASVPSAAGEKKSLLSHMDLPSQTVITERPKVVGHRGSVYQALENTLHGFHICSELGCDAIELDVFLQKCGELVVFHGGGSDKTPGCLEEYCGIDGSIMDYTATEARNLPFDPFFEEFACGPDCVAKGTELGHVYIPKLEEVLLAFRDTTDMNIKIELKGPNTEVPALELVERLGMVDRCSFSSFYHERIGRIRSLRPNLREDGTHQYRTGALFSGDLPSNFVEIALEHGASEVHLKYDTCTPGRIKAVHEAGMDSMAWFSGPRGMKEDITMKYYDFDMEDEGMYKAVMATGVKSMCVNKPHVLIDLIEKNGCNSMTME